MSLTPGKRFNSCVDNVRTILANFKNRSHGKTGSRVAVILYDYFRVFCLDHCAKFAKHCRLSHACHIFKAYFGSTCLYEFVGNGTVIFCSVNGRSCNAESGLRSHSCIESIVYARYYVAHVVQSAEYTGNVNALCVFYLVHELSHICRNGEHTQCIESAIKHVCFYSRFVEWFGESSYSLVGVFSVEKVDLFKCSAVCFHT